jgi:N-acetylmuramoyl-L-alanine amidase
VRRIGFIIVFSLLLLLVLGSVSLAAPGFKVNLVYTVQEGDTLYELARDFGLSVDELRTVNDLSDDEFISLGDKLIIPRENSKELTARSKDNQEEEIFLYQPEKESTKYSLDCNQLYEVRIKREETREVDVSNLRTLSYYIKPGDNLYDLAQEFNTSVRVVKKLNDLESDVIRLGDKIELPINNLTQKEVIYHTISDEELNLLARLIHGEARGEPYIGQVAVGAVILNRMISSYFPDTIRAVIYQPGQFSPVANGQINLRPNSTSYKAARAALQGQDPTRGAQYFYNPDTARHISWFEKRTTVVRIGDHVFAK